MQRRWSHSLLARSWLRPGLAGPIAPTRAGDSAGGTPRTPELGLHRRTKASQTRRLDAKFENKANLEELGVRVLAKPREGPQFWGSRPAARGGFWGLEFFRCVLVGDSAAARGSLHAATVSSDPTLPGVHCGVLSRGWARGGLGASGLGKLLHLLFRPRLSDCGSALPRSVRSRLSQAQGASRPGRRGNSRAGQSTKKSPF